jgi:hypothetical protein
MKSYSTWAGILACVLLIGTGSLAWAWMEQTISPGTISRGFLVGGVLALLLAVANLRTSYGFVQQNAPSYSASFYKTLGERKQLMFADMAQHSGWTKVLLSSGLASLVIAFLVFRFG